MNEVGWADVDRAIIQSMQTGPMGGAYIVRLAGENWGIPVAQVPTGRARFRAIKTMTLEYVLFYTRQKMTCH